ncbi:hypothetical protein [Aeromonas phage phiA014S]|uniref:Uncharacterized protein n=1 Tax=Aeromonas phage phiA014S TaxID=3119845 RepID=A0ABZ2CLZ8_9CAUD
MGDFVINSLEELRDSEAHICIHDLPVTFSLVEEGSWEQEHKSQYAQHIIKHNATGRHFCLNQGRSGSYHSEWYYSETCISEVKQVTETVVVTKWVPA